MLVKNKRPPRHNKTDSHAKMAELTPSNSENNIKHSLEAQLISKLQNSKQEHHKLFLTSPTKFKFQGRQSVSNVRLDRE